MVAFLRSHKGVFVKTAVVCVVSLTFVCTGLFFFNKNRTGQHQENNQTELSPDEESQRQVEQSIQQYAEANNQKANSMKSVDDLAKLEESEQGVIGILTIQSLIDQGKSTEAIAYIDYLMLREDGRALEAARFCYQIADEQSRRDACLQRMTELARMQGVIGPADTLPSSYYEQRDGDI